MSSFGVDVEGLVADPPRPTTVKRSLVGLAQGRHPQKMFRVDIESRAPLSTESEDRVIEAATEAMDGAMAGAGDQAGTVVCIEDYAKGVCTPRVCQGVIAAAKARGLPVLVDPAADVDFAKYRGATAITPNRTEAEAATRLKTHVAASVRHNAELARMLLTKLELEAVVLTLDRDGALLLLRDAGVPDTIPTVAREVYDVTGAGDMMLAGLAAGLANRLGWSEAVEFANAAAGLEVEVFGVESIPFERIHHDVLVRSLAGEGDRLRTLDQARVEVAALRSVGKQIVFTNGCFDVLHAGHVALLERARSFGDALIVGLNSDESVRRLKGDGRPVNTAADRARLLGALRAVDGVVVFEQDTPLALIEALKPDVLVKGADYHVDDVVGKDVVLGRGGRVELVDLVEGRSTTAIIEKVRDTAREQV